MRKVKEIRHVLRHIETGETAIIPDAKGCDPMDGYGDGWACIGEHTGPMPDCAVWDEGAKKLVCDHALAAQREELAGVLDPARLQSRLRMIEQRIAALEGSEI